MGQWEDKLGAILNDPQTMERIKAIAQSLEGGGEAPAPVEESGPAEPASALPDPRLMEAGMRALGAWRDPEDPRAALLQALRPFFKEERQGKVDKAVRVARLTRAMRAALDGLREEEADV